MRATPITDHLVQLTRLRAVNAYLVREDDGLTLVDTTTGGAAKALLAAARDAGGGELRRIVVTHAHGDHVGSLDALRRGLGDRVEVLVPARDARIMAGDTSVDAGEGPAKLKGSLPKVTTVPDVLLEPGMRVGSLEVVAAPGHTPGQVALLDPRSRALLCADAFSTLGGVATTAKPNPRFPLPALATWDRSRALETARALRALDPGYLAPGHGRVVADPGAAMDAAIAKAS